MKEITRTNVPPPLKTVIVASIRDEVIMWAGKGFRTYKNTWLVSAITVGGFKDDERTPTHFFDISAQVKEERSY